MWKLVKLSQMLRSGKEKRKEMVVPDLEEATLQRQEPLESLQRKERQGQKED